MKNFLAFALLASVAFLACSAEKIEPVEPIPTLFAPLSWEMDLKNLKKLFPKATIEEMEYMTAHEDKYLKTKAFLISSLDWPHFGEVYIRIHHNNYRHITLIQIETRESRAECNPVPTASAPKWCRHQYNNELRKTFNDVGGEISRQYGTPVKIIGSGDYVPDPRAMAYVWKRDGFKVIVDINSGEQEDWSVTLTAMRYLKSS